VPVPGCNTELGAVREACTGEGYLPTVYRRGIYTGRVPTMVYREGYTHPGRYNRRIYPPREVITGRFMLLR